MTSKSEIVEALQQRVVTVKFKKANGEERLMNCTLLPSMIPQTYNENAEAERKQNPDVVAAWDVDKQGWRSFRIDSIIEINK